MSWQFRPYSHHPLTSRKYQFVMETGVPFTKLRRVQTSQVQKCWNSSWKTVSLGQCPCGIFFSMVSYEEKTSCGHLQKAKHLLWRLLCAATLLPPSWKLFFSTFQKCAAMSQWTNANLLYLKVTVPVGQAPNKADTSLVWLFSQLFVQS